jgi:hypothetical protein
MSDLAGRVNSRPGHWALTATPAGPEDVPAPRVNFAPLADREPSAHNACSLRVSTLPIPAALRFGRQEEGGRHAGLQCCLHPCIRRLSQVSRAKSLFFQGTG